MAHKNKAIYPIGTKVYKISGNPFKSGFKVGTVTGVVTNEQDPKKRSAYTFEEDDSIVNCELCKTIEEHVPATLIDTRVGDTWYVIDNNYDIGAYKTVIITDIIENDDVVGFKWEGTINRLVWFPKKALKNSVFINHNCIIATTKNRVIATFINESEKEIKRTEDDIKKLENKISNLYRGISTACDMKRNNQ